MFERAHRLDPLFPLGVRNAEHHCFLYSRVLEDGLFNFCGVNIFPPGLDQFLFSPSARIPKKTFLIESTQVARMVPALPESVGRVLGKIPVSLEYHGASHGDFAHLPYRYRTIVIVQELHLGKR